MTTRPSFDEALAFWRELLRTRSLPTRLTWVFREDVQAASPGGVSLRPRSAGAGEWLARRAYDAMPGNDILVFTAHASADGHTVTGLGGDRPDASDSVRRDDWNLAFDASALSDPADLIALAPVRERLTANDRLKLRREALRDLVLLAAPVASAKHSLTDFAWDSDELLMLDKQHVLAVLRRFETDELVAAEIEAWANAIELRNDIGYDRETAVWDVLYELANPTLTEPLTRERADVLASVLKGH
jgi:hypothetical protein